MEQKDDRVIECFQRRLSKQTLLELWLTDFMFGLKCCVAFCLYRIPEVNCSNLSEALMCSDSLTHCSSDVNV